MAQIIPVLEAVRNTTPLVHCMTNTVVPEVTANVLLAAGAAPAMIDLPEEAEIFAGIASALLINVGNGSAEQHEGMRRAAPAAAAAGRPWVLDPVAVGGLPVRTTLARELLVYRPAAVRANASEVLGLVGSSGGGRGVDSTDEVEAALDAARSLVETSGAVVAISGPTDVVVSQGTHHTRDRWRCPHAARYRHRVRARRRHRGFHRSGTNGRGERSRRRRRCSRLVWRSGPGSWTRGERTRELPYRVD